MILIHGSTSFHNPSISTIECLERLLQAESFINRKVTKPWHLRNLCHDILYVANPFKVSNWKHVQESRNMNTRDHQLANFVRV